MSSLSPPKLRVATYLTPAGSIEIFETLLEYIEYKTNWHTTLLYESRFEGPPTERGDIFSDSVDLAFMSAYGFLKLTQTPFMSYELFPVSAVHSHPTRESNTPGIFVDIIVNRNMKDIKDFRQLRGVRWAHNMRDKLTGCLTLQTLKAMGESANFFTNILKSRSHYESLRMIIERKAHATAIDANSFQMYLQENPCMKEQLFRIETWGPLPPYAIVVRKNLSEDMKKTLISIFSEMPDDPMGKVILSSFNILYFDRINHHDVLETAQDLLDSTRTMSFDTVYY